MQIGTKGIENLLMIMVFKKQTMKGHLSIPNQLNKF